MSFFSNFSDKHRIKALVGLVTRHHVWHGISAVAGMGVLVLLLTASSAQAANITVANGEVAVAANGKCSLIEAINNANNTNNGRPHADCAAGNPNGADTINLPNSGNFVLTAPAVVAQRIGAIGLPWISSQVTINGNDSTIRRGDQAPELRILAVGRRGDLRLNNTTIRGGLVEVRCVDDVAYGGGGIFAEGKLTLNGSTIINNGVYMTDDSSSCYDTLGGGIFNTGQLTISNSTITSNHISSFQFQWGNMFAKGGGVYNEGQMAITDSSILNNETRSDYDAAGGGIYNEGIVTINNAVISDNVLYAYDGGDGGGIYNSFPGEITIEGSVVSGNSAGGKFGYGGGIVNGGTLTINRTLITDNSHSGESSAGGGIVNGGNLKIHKSDVTNNTSDGVDRGFGGGIATTAGEVYITETTISGNVTSAFDKGYVFGGDIYISPRGSLTISNSTVNNNEAFNSYDDDTFSGGIA
ncbi:MAG: hypothetical protein R6X18_08005, partial [Chloroflexota bacterium]